jgi:uncharacterized membrane protein
MVSHERYVRTHDTMSQAKQITRYLYGALIIAAGMNHFLNTPFYVRIMPPYLPWHLALVYTSGLAEIGFGALLLFERCSWVAAWGLIALLIAVFPANLHMALHPELYQWATPLGLWLRLPLQAVLIAWAYWYTRLPAPVIVQTTSNEGLSNESILSVSERSKSGVNREADGAS